jgi:hypothetical protein
MLEIYFGESLHEKEEIENLFRKFFPKKIISFRVVMENSKTHYGSIKLDEEEEEKFNVFFKEYRKLIMRL